MLVTKMLVSAAIVLGSGVVGAAPASADPNPSDTHPSPFASLSCDCQETAPASGLVLSQQIDRGIRQGFAHAPNQPSPLMGRNLGAAAAA
jgi:hypothetical protein